MDHLEQVPHFAWPAHRDSLEENPVVIGDTITTSLQSNPSPTEPQIITKIFTSATDFLSKTAENITSTNTDTFNITESTTEHPINVPEKYSKIKDMLGSAVSTEKPHYENGYFDSTSWEQPIIASSKHPLIDASEFGINMNTDSSSTIDTMKDILAEAVLKEKGLFEGETTEEPISTTSNTIRTLREMFMRAVAKEEPLFNTAKTESSLINFQTSTEKPLFETFSAEEPFFDINSLSKEQPFIQNITTTEAPIEFSTNTNSAMDKMIDIFNNSMPTEKALYEKYISEHSLNDSSTTTTNGTSETLKDMLSTILATEEPSTEFGSRSINGTINMMGDGFNEPTQTEQSIFQTIKDTLSTTLATEDPSIELGRRTFDQMNDMMSTSKASEEPPIDLSFNIKANNTMADIFNTSIPTEQPFLQTTSTFDNMKETMATQESAIEFGQSTFEKMKELLSTTEEASIEIGRIIRTNSTTDMIVDVFNISTPTEQPVFQLTNTFENTKNTLSSTDRTPIELVQSTFEQLKDMMSTTEESSIDFGLITKTNSTINIVADVFDTSAPIQQPFIQTTNTSEKIIEMLLSTEEPPIKLSQSTFEQLKDMLSTSEATEESPIVFDLSTKANGTTDMIAEVFDRSTLTERPFFQSTSTLEKMKDALTSQESVTEFGHGTFENMKDILTKTESSIDFRQSINTNSTISTSSTSEKIQEMLLSTEEPSNELLSESTFDQFKDMLSTTEAREETPIVFDLGIKTNGTTDIIAEVFDKSTLTEQPFFGRSSTFENIKDILIKTEPSIDFRQSINTNSTIGTSSASEKIQEMLLSTEEPSIELIQSTFEQLKDMLSTTEAREETPIVFDLGTTTNGTTDMIAEILDRSTLTEQPFFGRSSTFENIKDILSKTEPSIHFGQSLNTTIGMMEDVFETSIPTEQPFIQTTNTSEKIKEMLLSTEEPPIELSQSTIEQLKDLLSTTEATEESPIVFDLGTKVNGTTDMIAEVFDRSTLTEPPFFQSTSTFENIKDILTKTEPSIDFRQSLNTNSSIVTSSTSEKIQEMQLSTEEPSIELSQSTFEQLKDILLTTEAREETPIVFDLGAKTNGTTDTIAEVFDRSTLTEQPLFRSTNTFEKIKDMLPTEEPSIEFGHNNLEKFKDMLSTTQESSIEFTQSINTNGTVHMMSDMFNGSTSTQPIFVQNTSMFETIEDILATEEISIELGQSTFQKMKQMSTTEQPLFESIHRIKPNATDMMAKIFNESDSKYQTFDQDTKSFEKIEDMLVTEEPLIEFGQGTNTKSIIDMITDIFNGTTPTQKTFINNTTEESLIEFNESTFGKIQNILSTTEESIIQFEQRMDSNRTDMVENLFNGTTSTKQTFVQNTGLLEKIKDMLSTTPTTVEPSTEFGQTTYEMMKEIFNRSTSTEQNISLNNTFVTFKDMISVSPTEFGNNTNNTLALVKNINAEKTFEEPVNINATSTSTVDLTGIFRSAGVQEKLNNAFDIFTPEISTSFTSSTSLPENKSIYFADNVTSNSTEIFRTEQSIFQSTINTDFMDPIENNTLTEEAISNSISSIKETFEDTLSTISSNFSSTIREALGNADEQNQMAIESSWTIYLILGVILAVLIILTVGGYIICRKYRRNHKPEGSYYVTHMKDYSDSSVKTISDSSTVNIKL